MKVFEDALAQENETDDKPLVVINMSDALIAKYQPLMDGLNLRQIHKNLPFQDIHLIVTEQKNGGDDILNIGLEMDDEILLVGFSQGKDREFFTDDIGKFRNKFYFRNRLDKEKIAEGGEVETEERANPTGKLGVSYGAPGTVTVVSKESVDELAEPKVKAKPTARK